MNPDAAITVAIMDIDNPMRYSGDGCQIGSKSGSNAGKGVLSFPRCHCRRRFRGTLLFAMVIWMTEVTLLLLQNHCEGYLPTAFYSTKPLLYPSSLRRKEKRQQPWEHRLRHLQSATTFDTDPGSISSILHVQENNNIGKGSNVAKFSTLSTSFTLHEPPPQKSRRRRAWNFLKKKISFSKNQNDENIKEAGTNLIFSYDYDSIEITADTKVPSKAKTTGIMLIHPIGVGIARWYYQRLVSSLVAKQESVDERLVIVVPDLLGSGSACNATAGKEVVQKFPLFNISDWTDQVEALMSSVEHSSDIDEWCVVANGGCSPIALQLAERRKIVEQSDAIHAPVRNLVLSSVPRLPFFLKNETTNDPAKVAKSYRTLSGIPGSLFWWYSCRNNGAFIQTFSEKNLIADPKNLGPKWRSNCYETAISFDGKGRYATFSFLAGTLQDGCLSSLEAIKDSPLEINIIKGADVRRNRAKSWFWQKPKNEKKTTPKVEQVSDGDRDVASTTADASNGEDVNSYETFRDYVGKNGNGGTEVVIGGRISLAHEDPEGYAEAILKFLFD